MQFCLQSKFLIIAQETVSSLCSSHFQYILKGSDEKENTSNISSIVHVITLKTLILGFHVRYFDKLSRLILQFLIG